jgi:hypothetical protein
VDAQRTDLTHYLPAQADNRSDGVHWSELTHRVAWDKLKLLMSNKLSNRGVTFNANKENWTLPHWSALSASSSKAAH